MFIRFDMIHQRDRRTDRQTDGHRMTATAALMHSIARQKHTSLLLQVDFNGVETKLDSLKASSHLA